MGKRKEESTILLLFLPGPAARKRIGAETIDRIQKSNDEKQ